MSTSKFYGCIIATFLFFRVRHDLKLECEEYGIKLSFMPFFIKATSMALEKFPVLNSSLNKEESTITYKVQLLIPSLVIVKTIG